MALCIISTIISQVCLWVHSHTHSQGNVNNCESCSEMRMHAFSPYAEKSVAAGVSNRGWDPGAVAGMPCEAAVI